MKNPKKLRFITLFASLVCAAGGTVVALAIDAPEWALWLSMLVLFVSFAATIAAIDSGNYES